MRWLETIRDWWRDPVRLGGSAAPPSAPPAPSRLGSRRDLRPVRPRAEDPAHRPSAPPSRSSQEALSGYGNDPYDTYTWELHTSDDGDRKLKRAPDIAKPPAEGDKTNPYDTGTFRSPW